MEKSVLRRVQLGHGNKMSLQAAPDTGPSCSSSGSPSGSPPGNWGSCSHPASPPPIWLLTRWNLSQSCRERGMMGNSFPPTRRLCHRVEQFPSLLPASGNPFFHPHKGHGRAEARPDLARTEERAS